MGVARKIPEFIFSTLSRVAVPFAQAVGSHLQSASSNVKPNENMLNVLIETPLTPFAILTGVGGFLLLWDF